MGEFVPQHSHLVVLTFLASGFLLLTAGIVFVHALYAGRKTRAGRVFLVAVTFAALYGGLLVGVSLASEEKTLGEGRWKYFCEVDCHLAYSVVNVEVTKSLGSGKAQATAAGNFHVVTLKTWFDEDTVSTRRPQDLTLSPNLRAAWLVDAEGRRFATSLAGQKALDFPAGRNLPLTQHLLPGESYETVLVFDVPDDAQGLRLFLTDPWPVNRLLIGHENSFFHKKVYFSLSAR